MVGSVVWGLLLSSLAGGSTVIGGLVGVISRPSESLLAFLLGTAIGVMALLSFVEMLVHNALQNGWVAVTFSFTCGALLYRIIQPMLPDFNHSHLGEKVQVTTGRKASQGPAIETKAESKNSMGKVDTKLKAKDDAAEIRSKLISGRSAELFRLGLLMSLTMTLHNLPEGFAVAFSSLTDFGPLMAMAIAVHNIPEGIIVAAPVYAATGSRWKAVALAGLSGLSEPLGASIALLSVKPIISETSLHFMLAFVGGIMGAVCWLELWPEGKKCKSDQNLLLGILVGAVIMGLTLLVV